MEYSFTDGEYRVTLRSTQSQAAVIWVFQVDRLHDGGSSIATWDSVLEEETLLSADLSRESALSSVRRIADTLLPMLTYAELYQVESYAKHLAKTLHLQAFDPGAVKIEAKLRPSNSQRGASFTTTAPAGLPLRAYRLIAIGLFTREGVLGGNTTMFLNGKEYDLP